MKPRIKAIGVISIILMALPKLVFAGPKMTIGENEFDFGYVPQASKVSHDFWLHSTGDSTLKIIKVNPG